MKQLSMGRKYAIMGGSKMRYKKRRTYIMYILVFVLLSFLPLMKVQAQCGNNLQGPTNLCAGSTGTLVFAGSNAATTYALFKNGNLIGSNQQGTGTFLNFSITGPGNYY